MTTKWKRHQVTGSSYTILVPVSSGDGVEEMLSQYYAIGDVHIYELGDESIEYVTEHHARFLQIFSERLAASASAVRTDATKVSPVQKAGTCLHG